jgi:hypothetical protein
MKRLLISHIDGDGQGSIILERVYHDKLGFDAAIELDYGWEEDVTTAYFVERFDEIVMADISVSESYFTHLTQELGKRVTIYDHHVNKDSEWLGQLRGSVLDDSRCGTKIFFEEYVCKRVHRVSQVVLDMIERIDNYDRWRIDEISDKDWEEALSLNRVLYAFTNYDEKGIKAAEAFIKIQARKLVENDSWVWTSTERMAIEKAKEAEDRRYDEAMRMMQLRQDCRGARFGVFSIPGKISIVCSRILRSPTYEFLDYVIVINSYGGVTGNMSARSSRGFDCTRLSPFNGHEAAAGGAIDKDEAAIFLKKNMCFTYKDDKNFIDNGVHTVVCP